VGGNGNKGRKEKGRGGTGVWKKGEGWLHQSPTNKVGGPTKCFMPMAHNSLIPPWTAEVYEKTDLVCGYSYGCCIEKLQKSKSCNI
jgi:hypothetical protein